MSIHEAADPHLRGGCPCNALVTAMSFNRTSILDQLMWKTTSNQVGPQGRAEYVRYVLAKGADGHIEIRLFLTPLQDACFTGHKLTLELPLQHNDLLDVPEKCHSKY